MRSSLSHSAMLSIVVSFIAFSVASCSSGTSTQNQYVSTLEQLIGTRAKTDGYKQAIMSIYGELGGSDTSTQRANQACESLRSGKVVEEVTQTQSLHAIKDLNLNGLGRSWNDEEMKRISYATDLYLAEIFAAQSAICPETKVELKL